MTTRQAEPVTAEQVQELPRDVSPYLQALVLAYLASGGEDSEQTNRRAVLFRKALAAAALGAFLFRDRDKDATVDIDFTETAEPFTAAVKESVNDYLARDDEGRDSKTDSKFAESVASTLSTGAANRLTLEVLNQLDPDGTAYKKLWLTRGDEKVRLSHRELHGRTASVGEPFKKGLNYPGDPTAPLDERINCRCFLFAVPSDKDTETANAFEPADLTTAFAASATLHVLTAGDTLRRLINLAPWLWQPRDSIGRWVEVGDIMNAPGSSGKGRENGRVVEVIGKNRVRLESLRFPGRTWDVDSRDTAQQFFKGRLGMDDRPTLPHLQPIPTPKARGLPPEFGELTPEIPNRPVERELRTPVYGLDQQVAGAPIFESDELTPGKVVVVESKSKPGTFRHMVVDEVGEDGNTVLLLYPPEPRRKSAEATYQGPHGQFEYNRVFQLQSPSARQEVFLNEGVLYEPADPDLAQEVTERMDMGRYGFANPYWFSSTEDAFKQGGARTDWNPERKELHDKIIQETFDAALVADGPPIFYLMGGGPASGKSTMLEAELVQVPTGNGAIQVNADDIKFEIPEFIGLLEANEKNAAQFVHEESSDISGRMVREAPLDKHIVMDGVADKGAGAVLSRLETARKRNMRIVANYATLPTDMAIRLADERGAVTGRYVPHPFIEKTHADVVDTFFDLAKGGVIHEMWLWNNEIFREPRLIFSQVDGVSKIHDEALLLEFLNKSKTKRHTMESVVAMTDSGFAFPPAPPYLPPTPTPPGAILPEVSGVAGEVPASLAAAGLEAVVEDGYWNLDYDTMERAAIEVSAEMRGSVGPSRLPDDDPQINAFKEALRAEFAANPDRQYWLPNNP